MNVVFLGMIVMVMYFASLHVLEPYLNKHTDRIMQYSANLWITLGGIALLAGYHQSLKNDAKQQAELALRLSEKWGDINTYLADRISSDHRLTPLVRLFYGQEQEQGPIDMNNPSLLLGLDYIIDKCYEMWVLGLVMDINLSHMNTRTNYNARDEETERTTLSHNALMPNNITVGSVFVIPEFYTRLSLDRTGNGGFYPDAFIEYVNVCISLYCTLKNASTRSTRSTVSRKDNVFKGLMDM